MRLYRVAEPQFARDLSGEGARVYGGRWNPKGISMIYTAESVALAALEVLIRLCTPKRFSLVKYDVAEGASMETVDAATLPADWYHPGPNAHLIECGRSWASEKRSLILKVPSSVVHGEEFNYLINPLHPQIPLVTIAEVTPFELDPRLTAKP